jgi:hypothetical protein
MQNLVFLALLLAARTLPALGSQQEPAQEPKPDVPRGLVLNEDGAFDGYTLIAPLTSRTITLLDMEGEVVHRWVTERGTESGILLDNGNLLCLGFSFDDNPRFKGPGIGGGLIQEIDWDGNVVWKYGLNDDYQLLHHDIARMPNGNILFIAWEHRYVEDAIEWGRDPAQVGRAGMWPDAVFEIRPTRPEGAEIVWEWHVWDHVIQDHDSSKSNHGSVPDNPGRVDINADHRGIPPLSPEEIEEREELARQMAALGYGGEDEDEEEDVTPRSGTAPDWLHTNALDYHPEQDLIVLSTPNLNELWVIDHSTTTEEAAGSSGGRWGKGGDLLWRWGNPRNYGSGDDADRRLFFQHEPKWIPGERPGELRILVYNNGRGRPEGAYSTVDELVLPFDPEQGFVRTTGEAFGPAGPAWSHGAPGGFFSSFISGTKRLPNGNTLICSGTEGHIFEVTRAGRVVWDYWNPFGGDVEMENNPVPVNSLYRATRIAKDHPGLAGRKLVPE